MVAIEPATCPWCASASRRGTLTGRERQLEVAAPAEETYVQCGDCGGLFAEHQRADLAAHYPSTYYSFAPGRDSWLTRVVRGQRARAALNGTGLFGSLIGRRFGVPVDLASVARLQLPTTSRILDIGAGSGRLLRDLSYAGYTQLLGADPFGADDPGPPRLVRQSITGVHGEWDLVMYHHCLEHIERPDIELACAMERLAPDGRILIRIPLVDCDAADEYGDRWVQLDAPRHRAIPTAVSIERLATRLGLQLADEWRDSSAFQFWGSELYLLDVPLRGRDPAPERRFPAALMAQWTQRAAEANRRGRGDQGAFVLRRA